MHAQVRRPPPSRLIEDPDLRTSRGIDRAVMAHLVDGAWIGRRGRLLMVSPRSRQPCRSRADNPLNAPVQICRATSLRLTYIVMTSICLQAMILGYRDKKTENFARGEFVKAFQGFEDQAAKRLAILNAAPSLDTLRALPSNRLEALRGDRAGQFSIRVNQQWRICFEWPEGQPGPSNVEIVDYH